ncbi:unnamed protein product [Vitrella brassicaformis CCMP3155]|uniref:Uncharacterized protein n=1 Tax=Vitrella brassicaformis (strain CCMP3155) TaxID=1169540 RepID=A0A0G4FDL4_VITBC|nr:unnamed protein product [Vitrella brassicaformis CCMP3155]|eukprot:CEM11028.1 unnamed protein product [Vitrella brassicaformis CCMP3155]
MEAKLDKVHQRTGCGALRRGKGHSSCSHRAVLPDVLRSHQSCRPHIDQRVKQRLKRMDRIAFGLLEKAFARPWIRNRNMLMSKKDYELDMIRALRALCAAAIHVFADVSLHSLPGFTIGSYARDFGFDVTVMTSTRRWT